MQCPRCQQESPPQARFCMKCGAGLTLSCAKCNTELPIGAAFCLACGEAVAATGPAGRFASPQAYTPKHLAEKILVSKGALEGERKQVTVLFADVKGSMELLADRDPEEARKLLDPVLERMMEAVHRYEGTVNQVMGDGIMALFGAPVAHEDHAVRACYAAFDMQAAMRRYTGEVRRSHGIQVEIRVGLNSGEVVVRAIGSDLRLDYSAIGQTTHLAARMEQLAPSGGIRLTADTLRLAEGYIEVKPLGPVPVKGLEAPVEIYEMVGAGPLRSRLHAAAARGFTRFVGRESELEQLRQALARAAAGHGQVVAIVGEPGVGKSRLVWEVTHSHRTHGWLIVASSSVSYGKATPYLPVIDLLKAYFRIQDRDDQREIREKVTGKLLTLDRALEPMLPALLALLGLSVEEPDWQALDPQRRRQRTLDALKRLLLRESQVRPLLVVVEDLHWIDSETQALLDGLVDSLPAARLFLLVNYRPEYQHAWGSKTYYSQIRLDPLPPESAEELLEALLGRDAGLRPLTQLLVERTEGNPFFLEESVRTLIETQLLVGERGAYRLAKPVQTIQVPATVQAVLAARIDRLPPEDKRLLQAAAVIGKDVPFALLQAIAELAEEGLRRGLTHLQGAEFLYEARLFPDLEYTFKHALTHEVAYGGLLQERRRELHRQVAAALERLAQDRIEEYYGLLARHFVESGDLAKGLAYSFRAGVKAAALFAHDEAVRHYERARTCAEALSLPDQVVAADEAMGDVELARGRLERAVDVYERALERAPTRAKQAQLKFKIGHVYGQFADARGVEFLQTALAELDPASQRRELAMATALLGRYRHHAAQHAEAVEFLERARELAEALDDPEALTIIYGYLAGAYQHMARLAESMEWARRCVALGERAGYQPALMLGYTFLAEGSNFLGKWDDALGYASRCRQIAEHVGAAHRLAWAEHDRAWTLYGKGELAPADRAARTALMLADATGERRIGVFTRQLLSDIQTDLGTADEEAEALARAAVAAADALGDRMTRSFSRSALVYFHRQREEWGRAAGVAEETARLLAGSDNRSSWLAYRAYVAEVAWGQGRLDEAARLIAGSIALAREAGARHFEGVVQRVWGQVLTSERAWDQAALAFGAAIQILGEAGSRLELGRALYSRGVMHRARGGADEARADLLRAHAIFAEAGARRDEARAKQALEATGS